MRNIQNDEFREQARRQREEREASMLADSEYRAFAQLQPGWWQQNFEREQEARDYNIKPGRSAGFYR